MIAKQDFARLAAERRYIAVDNRSGALVNLAGAYDYLESPYYISQDMESEGKEIRPTCKEMLDAYVTPIFLEKARLAGLPIPEYYITNGYFEPPVIVDPINPFMIRSRTVWKNGRQESVARSMSRNFTYAICCQEIPAGAKIKHFQSVLGWSAIPAFRNAASSIWEIFHIPLAKVRILVKSSGEILFSDLSQLPFGELSQREMAYIKDSVRWDV